METKKELYSTFMVVNFVATILIISIHYQSNQMINSNEYFKWNYLIQEIIINGFARVSVPSFALISGFFTNNHISISTIPEMAIPEIGCPLISIIVP